MDVPTTHRFTRKWDDIGPFTLYEVEPIHATQEWRSEEYFVAIRTQNKWLSRASFGTLSDALMAMADYLDNRS